MRSPYLLASTVCLFILTGCIFAFAQVKRTEKSSAQHPVAGFDRLAVDCPNGAVRVAGSAEARQVEVQAVKTARATSEAEAEACLKAIDLYATSAGRTLQLGWRWAGKPKRGWSGSVDYTITIPKVWTVSVAGHNGAVAVRHLAAATSVTVDNGSITIEDVAGKAVLRSHNGALDVSGLSGDIEARTNNGRIAVQGRCSRVRLESDNGAIEADLTSGAVVNGEVATRNGSITLRFGKQASVQVECRTQSGAIHTGAAVQTVEKAKGRVVGRIGAGEGRFSAHTNNGAISIE
jgi:hypothetical protein